MNDVERTGWKNVLYSIDQHVVFYEKLVERSTGGAKLLARYELDGWKHAQRSVLNRLARTKKEDPAHEAAPDKR